MIAIRPMRDANLEAVRRVDAAAFTLWWQQLTGKAEMLPPRTSPNVTSLLEKDPEGCYVAEADGRTIGFIFSRTWGSVGWPGTFAVLPEYQGRGVGKQLLAASLRYLRQDPRRIIGLETMPDSESNLGLYLKQGFRLSFPTLLLCKQLDGIKVSDTPLLHWSAADRNTQGRWQRELREVTNSISPGLDYAKEITSTARHGFGETLILADDRRVVGFTTVWLTGIREGSGGDVASVQVAALDPARTDKPTLRALIDSSEALACAHQKKEIIVPVNSCFTWALDQLLDAGYRVARMSARLLLAGAHAPPFADSLVDLSRWAG